MTAAYMELVEDLSRNSHSSFCLDLYFFSVDNALTTKPGDKLMKLFGRTDNAKNSPRFDALKEFAQSFGRKHLPIIPLEYRIPSLFSDDAVLLHLRRY